jgi:8-oxo-dGTP pyrophosphatase MutT (NUDIX family)
MISVLVDGVRFNYRVAAYIVDDEQILLCRVVGNDSWFLPGGRVDPMETSAAALQREIAEELRVTASVGRLLWIAEGLYSHGGQSFHELGLYFETTLPAGSPLLEKRASFRFSEGESIELECAWHSLETLDSVAVYPLGVAKELSAPPESIRHLINDERSRLGEG